MDLKLQQFEGPLDLLLHLIKANKLDIYDIPIFELTQQYIDYLKKMEELNMEIASEFIVMASELLYIKSKMLLPSEKPLNPEEEEEDPRLALMKRLIEYKKYTEISAFFKEREYIGINSYTKPKERIKGLVKYHKINMETSALMDAMSLMSERVMQRLENSKEVFFPIVEREIVSVSDMEKRLFEALDEDKPRELVDLFVAICASKPQVSAAFMALLNMVKEEKIHITEVFYDNETKFMLTKLSTLKS